MIMKKRIMKIFPTHIPVLKPFSHGGQMIKVNKYLIFGLIILSMLLMAAWSSSDPGINHYKKPTRTPVVTTIPGTPTPYPEEIVKNQEQTNEIVLVGVFLVLIVVGGTFSIISRKN